MELRRIKKQLVQLLINIISSGKYSEKSEFGMSDYLIRYVLLNFSIFSGCGILAAYMEKPLDNVTKNIVKQISDYVLMAEYERAIEIIEQANEEINHV